MHSSLGAEYLTAKSRLEAAGQGHVLAFWDELSEAERRELLGQVKTLDLGSLESLIERYVRSKPGFDAGGELRPAPYYPADPASGVRAWDRAEYMRRGVELIAQGKVAAFTVAGGQGSRLGFEGPKGCFPAGAVTRKSLFSMLADWVRAAQERFAPGAKSPRIPWYIMTSPLNHDATVAHFERHDYFGLRREDVMLFPQGILASLDIRTGALLLEEKGRIAVNPDGHGGSLRALKQSGALADLRRRGVEHLSYTQVDNPLVRVIDPVFLGLHASAPDSSREMSSKMIPKASPEEKLGVFCESEGRVRVIEYSDLPAELARERLADGSLRFLAGSIAVHVIGVEFIDRLTSGGVGSGLPLHRAEKRVAHVDPRTGKRVNPSEANAVKLEMFVFDALAFCKSSVILETDRIEEFAPIKNAEGPDSPATCTRIQTKRAARWFEKAGVGVPKDGAGEPECTLEVSPRRAMWAEDVGAGAKPVLTIEPGSSLSL